MDRYLSYPSPDDLPNLSGDREDNIETKSRFTELTLEELGFLETEDLSAAKEAIIAGLLSGTSDDDPTLTAAWYEYAVIVESVVEQIPSGIKTRDAYKKMLIAAIVHKARLLREAGRTLRYLQELDVASTYAYNSGFDTLYANLEEEIDVYYNG